MQAEGQSSLESKIAGRFEDIADVGWFPDDVADDAAQLQVVRDVLQPRAGQKILDAGCARGRFVRRLLPSGALLYGIDLTWPFIAAAAVNVPEAKFARGSMSALPFADGVFDAAYCVEALEHVPATALAVSELARVVKPGGIVLIIDKSLQGLDPGKGLPNFLVKPWAERTGRWMYPPEFGFRERWFWPKSLARVLRSHCRSVEVRFIPEGRGKASRLYRLLPFLSLDVAWIGKKL
jgi:SAM-dependent methyltransferase